MSQSTLGFVLHDVARLMRKRFDQWARAAELTRSQWQVLAKLSIHEGLHQKGLADLLEIESVTLVRLLDKMQGAAWSSVATTPRIAIAVCCISPRPRIRC
nr:MarR family transcriptional regulator [uncultured Pseudomonas sp.]